MKHGAVCFTTPRLCPAYVKKQAVVLPVRVADGKGAGVVLAGFHPEDLGAYEPLLPPVGNTQRLKFTGKTVVN